MQMTGKHYFHLVQIFVAATQQKARLKVRLRSQAEERLGRDLIPREASDYPAKQPRRNVEDHAGNGRDERYRI